MRKAFEKKLRLVWLRCGVNLLLEQTGRVLIMAGAIAVLAVLVERLLALSVIRAGILWTFLAAAVVLIVLLWWANRPGRMQVSLLLDDRLKLHERFSTTLALAESTDPFASAARAEARETAKYITPHAYFPIRLSRRWSYATASWAIVTALFLFMPQEDLLGLFAKSRNDKEHAKQVELAQSDVNDTTKVVKSVLQQLDVPELADDLAALGQIPQKANPEEIKRQAIRKLGDLSDELKRMQAGTKLESLNLLQQMLRQLPGSPDAVSQKLRLALAQGNFAQASNLLKQMQKELMQGELSEQQRKELAEKLQQLAGQLKQLAAKNKELEKELEKLGLEKKLAKLSEQQLRDALTKKGLSAEKIEQLLQKAAASRMACSRCSGLGRAMASCGGGAGGLAGDQLSAVTDQLDELEALQQRLKLTQAALDQIGLACQCLGQGMCQGLGCRGPFSKGPSGRVGSGTGGPGIGIGPRGYDDSGQTSTKKTKVQNKSGEGPVIASWYFKGTQVRGEARRDFAEVVKAGRDSASEAVTEHEIPRKYAESVKGYFGHLEESGSD